MIYCLEHLGPWCAAAAAYLDLLAPPVTAEEEAAAAEAAALEEAGNVWQEGEEDEEDGEYSIALLCVALLSGVCWRFCRFWKCCTVASD